MQTDFSWQMQSFPCKVSSALIGPPNSLMVPRVLLEITGTGLAVEHSQGTSSRGGCRASSSSASAELLLLPWDFIPFPDLEDAAGKGQDLLNPGAQQNRG